MLVLAILWYFNNLVKLDDHIFKCCSLLFVRFFQYTWILSYLSLVSTWYTLWIGLMLFEDSKKKNSLCWVCFRFSLSTAVGLVGLCQGLGKALGETVGAFGWKLRYSGIPGNPQQLRRISVGCRVIWTVMWSLCASTDFVYRSVSSLVSVRFSQILL